jgi:glycerol-3-phosphate dehydrogenase
VHCGRLSAKGRSYGNAIAGGGKEEEWKGLPKTNMKSKGKLIAAGTPKELDWFDTESITGYSEMGTPSTTAQVHPYQFTTSMADLAQEAGAKVILGSVTAIDYSGPQGVKSVVYEDKETKKVHTIATTEVVLAAGPWTSHVFPDAPIDAIRAHCSYWGGCESVCNFH